MEKYGADLANKVMQRAEAVFRNFNKNVSQAFSFCKFVCFLPSLYVCLMKESLCRSTWREWLGVERHRMWSAIQWRNSDRTLWSWEAMAMVSWRGKRFSGLLNSSWIEQIIYSLSMDITAWSSSNSLLQGSSRKREWKLCQACQVPSCDREAPSWRMTTSPIQLFPKSWWRILTFFQKS